MFPWARELEAKTDAIREELKTALATEGKEFAPYIAYRPGDPVNQWADLNHSTRWSHYSLWRGGVPDDIPDVALAGVPLAIGALLKQAGLAPSTSEASRLIEQGGVRIDGAVVADKGLKLGAGRYVVQVGKRKFARVTLS